MINTHPFLLLMGGYVIHDSFSLGLGDGQRIAYVLLVFISVVMVAANRNPMRLTRANLQVVGTWGVVILIGFLMACLQEDVHLGYIAGDAISVSYPLLILMLGSQDRQIFNDRPSLSFLGVILLCAVLTGAQSITESNRFFEPPLILMVLTWLWVAQPRSLGMFWLAIAVLGFLMLMTLLSGARTSLILSLASGVVLFLLGHFSRQTVTVLCVLGSILLVPAGLGTLEIDLSRHLRENRIGSILDNLSHLGVVDGVSQDDSVMNRFYEADDALFTLWHEHGPIHWVLGCGHGATFKAATAYYGDRVMDNGYSHHIHLGLVLLYFRYGVLGVMAFAWLFVSCLRQLVVLRKSRHLDDLYFSRTLFTISTAVYLCELLLFNEILNVNFSFAIAGFLHTRLTDKQWTALRQSARPRSLVAARNVCRIPQRYQPLPRKEHAA